MNELNMKVNTVFMEEAVKFCTKVIGLNLQYRTGKENIIDQPGVHIEFKKLTK